MPDYLEPNIKGSTLLLATVKAHELDNMSKLDAELDGSICGYLFDKQRPELVTLQVREGHPEIDLAWAKRTIVEGMARSTTVLEELPDGSTCYHGTVSRCLFDPFRFKFLLVFSEEGDGE